MAVLSQLISFELLVVVVVVVVVVFNLLFCPLPVAPPIWPRLPTYGAQDDKTGHAFSCFGGDCGPGHSLLARCSILFKQFRKGRPGPEQSEQSRGRQPVMSAEPPRNKLLKFSVFIGN